MKVVNITGGLGNQMFQYAFAEYLKHRYPEEQIYVDTSHYNSLFFKRFKGINLHNGFEIENIFPNATIPLAKFKQISKVSYWIPDYVLSRIARKILPIRKTEYIAKYNMNFSFDQEALIRTGNCYYEGYWQCIKYLKIIKEELLSIYSPSVPNNYNTELIHEIENCNSVGIHVRRGDYLSEPEFNGICDVDYYKRAITDITTHSENCAFYIFSNDIEWCKNNLVDLFHNNKYSFITENKGKNSYWDMFLMTHCKNLIIANSSFSWWGAFLNKNANKIYAPYPWVNRNCDIDLYEDNWIMINCKTDNKNKHI